MEAIPLADRPGVPTLAQLPPREVAPSQALYARPGLPGERPAALAPARESEVPLSPEREAIATYLDQDVLAVALGGAEAPAAAAPAAPARRDTPDRSGLRFGDDVVRRELEDETATGRGGPARGGPRGRRGGTSTAAERARPAAAGRRNRRFEVAEEDIEEGLDELHGEEFDFDFEDEDDKG